MTINIDERYEHVSMSMHEIWKMSPYLQKQSSVVFKYLSHSPSKVGVAVGGVG